MAPQRLALQVQKLLARHKAELSAAQQAAADEARRALDVVGAQHELATRQLKERLAKVTMGGVWLWRSWAKRGGHDSAVASGQRLAQGSGTPGGVGGA